MFNHVGDDPDITNDIGRSSRYITSKNKEGNVDRRISTMQLNN